MDLGKKKYELITECVTCKDNVLYSVGREMNVLFSIDLKTNKVEAMSDMPDESNLVERLYNGICIENDNLILVPFNAKKLWIYKFSIRKWSAVDISSYVAPDMKGKFAGGVLRHNIVYLFGYKYCGILTVNIDTKEVRELLTGEDQGHHVFWGQSIAECNEKIFLVSSLANVAICINSKESTYDVIKLDDILVSSGICNDAVTYSNNTFFIKKLRGNTFYKWIPFEKTQALQIDSFYNSSESFFNGIVAAGKYLIFYSPKGKSYIYDCKNPQDSYILEEKLFFAKYIPDVGTILCKKGHIIVCDSLLQKKADFEISVDERTHKEYIKNSRLTSEILKENNYINVKDFIDLISTV